MTNIEYFGVLNFKILGGDCTSKNQDAVFGSQPQQFVLALDMAYRFRGQIIIILRKQSVFCSPVG